MTEQQNNKPDQRGTLSAESFQNFLAHANEIIANKTPQTQLERTLFQTAVHIYRTAGLMDVSAATGLLQRYYLLPNRSNEKSESMDTTAEIKAQRD